MRDIATCLAYEVQLALGAPRLAAPPAATIFEQTAPRFRRSKLEAQQADHWSKLSKGQPVQTVNTSDASLPIQSPPADREPPQLWQLREVALSKRSKLPESLAP